MKKFILYLFLGIILIGCGAKKQYVKGNYDAAIRKAVTKLRKNPDHLKTLTILEDAFLVAQNTDISKIELLKREGAPENWDQIFRHYKQIKTRQDLVSSKQKAAEFYYANGQQLLANNNRRDARMAYDEFMKVKGFYQNFKDVDQLLDQSREKGTAYVLFKMENNTGMIMPSGFEQEILKISLARLNDTWTQFHTTEKEGNNYHYYLKFNMSGMAISPEQMKEVHYVESDTIQDGWDYVKDENGNVMKDSLGNDIKTKKFIKVSCNIVETQQFKTATVSGNLDFFNIETQQLIQTVPVRSDATFEHYSAKANGDLRALSAQTKQKIKSRPAPFPSDEQLIMMGTTELKESLKRIITQNKRAIN